MEKLKLKDVRWEPPFNINYGMADLSIRNLIERDRYQIDWDVYLPSRGMNLQRGFIWTLDQKRELVYSLFKGIKIAPISVISYDHKVYKIIDGKQRLSTILSFCKNEFPVIWNSQEYYFKDLDWDIQGEFLSHGTVRADIGYEYPDKRISDDDLVGWFEMINFSGTPQDKEHLTNLKTKI